MTVRCGVPAACSSRTFEKFRRTFSDNTEVASTTDAPSALIITLLGDFCTDTTVGLDPSVGGDSSDSMASSFFAFLSRRGPPAPTHSIHFPYTWETNPFHAKRTWPPDFSKLSTKHQFRLERRYRRRTKLKWARPTWVKVTKLAQWGSILFVLGYGVFFLEMEEGAETPFDGIRRWYKEQMSGFQGERARHVEVEGNAVEGVQKT